MSLISHAAIMSKTSDRILADTHVHTEFSGDSTAPVHSQIEQALALGMKAVSYTHLDVYKRQLSDCLPCLLPAVSHPQ